MFYTPNQPFPTSPRSHHPSSASSNYAPWRRQRCVRLLLLAACGTLILVGSSYLYFGPSAGLPIPDCLAPYYLHAMFPGGNHGSAHDEHPHPGALPFSL
ncbi:hypothetical protein B0H13DRAFT_2333265 [Mycena leptocephala]|nr:hypothetical protein B0H13DRAFT_2333265 [Mycena leptocephala]